MNHWKIIGSLIVWMGIAQGIAGEIPYLDAKVKTLVTFKDGTVFLLKEGTVVVGEEGKVVTAPITDAAFGTVGVESSTSGVHVKMLTASAAPDSSSQARTFVDARRNAFGRPLVLKRRGQKEELTGELLSLRNPSGFTQRLGMPSVEDKEELVLSIKQPDGVIALVPMSEVEEWKFLDAEAIDRDPDRTGQHLTITLEGTRPGQEVTVSYYYLWKGVKWTPSYLLERQKGGEVKLELRGEITNHLIDLTDTEIHLVVGVPNFLFVDTPSPMVAQKTLEQVTSSLNQHHPGLYDLSRNAQFTNVYNNRIATTNESIEVRQPTPEFAEAAGLPDAASTDAGNLHLFTMDGIDLGKGERAILHLAKMELACRDLVAWEVSDDRVRRANHTPSPEDRAKNPLIHYWLLKAGNVPLTTGPALVMKGDVALSQDQIYYTPRHTEGRYKVGTAVNMVGVAIEEVISRVAQSKEVKDRQSHHHGKPFWLMKEVRWTDETRELKLQLRNEHAFETAFSVTRQFRGIPEPSEDVQFQSLGAAGEKEDQLNRVRWEGRLKPSETREVTLRYVTRVFEVGS